MQRRYRDGDVPWDAPEPPPEVVELAAELPPGRALDIGCGFGRAAIHLALRGWQVDAVDFVPEALAEARRRAARAGVADRIEFLRVTVPDLGVLRGPYDLVLDVGCGHALDRASLSEYVDEMKRVLRPGGQMAWFLRLRQSDEDEATSGPRGVVEGELRRLLEPGFELERVERSRSGPYGAPQWPSAWFWLRRRAT
jgi:cyclopropane fatty-acyl-phospholipid synthase-like methyltransferase